MKLKQDPTDTGKCVYLVDNVKYYQKRDCRLQQIFVSGWLFHKNSKETAKIEIYGIEKEKVTIDLKYIDRQDVCDMYDLEKENGKIGFQLLISSKEQFENVCDEIILCAETAEDREELIKITTKELKDYQAENIHYMIDQFALHGTSVQLAGWGYFSDEYECYEPLQVQAKEENSDRIIKEAEFMRRPDVAEIFHSEDDKKKSWGFLLTFDLAEYGRCKVCFGQGEVVRTVEYNLETLQREKREKKRKYKNKLDMLLHKDKLQSADDRYYREHLSKEAYENIINERLNSKNITYDVWRVRNLPSEKELKRQSKEHFAYEPKISIAVPAYRTPEGFLREMIESVQKQTYANWELCIADGSLDGSITNVLKEYADKDGRVKFSTLEGNYGISGNTNKALELATGDYVALLDHDDVITEDALYEMVKCVNEQNADCVYSDEDKVDFELEDYFEPHFKPDFNLDMIRSCNYICHFFMVKQEIIDKVGMFLEEFDGSQDFDFILRCTSAARKVAHVPKILYHWRCHAASTAMNPENKMYCYDAGRRAIEANLSQHDIEGAEVSNLSRYGFYKVKYPLIGMPLVTIVMLNENKEYLSKCKANESIYPNTEIIFVEKSEWNTKGLENKILNSKGEYILFLKGIVKDIQMNLIEDMIANCQREEVGVIGAMVYNELNMISDSGKVIGTDGKTMDLFRGISKDDPGYAGHGLVQQDVSFVSDKCMMLRKSVYDAVDEKSNTGICKWTVKNGKSVVYSPYMQIKVKQDADNAAYECEGLYSSYDPNYSPNFQNGEVPFSLDL